MQIYICVNRETLCRQKNTLFTIFTACAKASSLKFTYTLVYYEVYFSLLVATKKKFTPRAFVNYEIQLSAMSIFLLC